MGDDENELLNHNALTVAYVAWPAVRARMWQVGRNWEPDAGPHFDTLPEWRQESMLAVIRRVLEMRRVALVETHALWAKTLRDMGWRHDMVTDVEDKRHAAMVPWKDVHTIDRELHILLTTIADNMREFLPVRLLGAPELVKPWWRRLWDYLTTGLGGL